MTDTDLQGADPESTATASTEEKPRKKRFKFKVPTAFTVLFILTILSVVATWFVPAGAFAKLVYDPESGELQITEPGSDEVSQTLPATQESLDQLGLEMDIQQFLNGSITDPISVPDTYASLAQNPAGLADIPLAMVHGTMEAIDVIIFIFALGGLIGVVQLSGAFTNGLLSITQKTKGREFTLVFVVSVLLALGGALCGIEEEAVAFYPILVPVFIALGYDSIVSVGAIFLASSMGTAFAFVNPFSVVIASNAAGIPFTDGMGWRIGGFVVAIAAVIGYLYWYARKIKADPTASYTYEDREEFAALYDQTSDQEDKGVFDWRQKLVLVLFVFAFVMMVIGVLELGWWFPTMAALFLTIAIVIMLLIATDKKNPRKEEEIVDAFANSAASLLPVSLIIGLARGINKVLNEGFISDTLLEKSSEIVQNFSGPMFVLMLLVIFFFLGFIVPSSSGLAVLAMPIMAPLADAVGLPRFVVVLAYQWGQYAMLFLAPTGLVMATLQMLHMRYEHWLRFIWPVVAAMLVFAAILLVTISLIYG